MDVLGRGAGGRGGFEGYVFLDPPVSGHLDVEPARAGRRDEGVAGGVELDRFDPPGGAFEPDTRISPSPDVLHFVC